MVRLNIINETVLFILGETGKRMKSREIYKKLPSSFKPTVTPKSLGNVLTWMRRKKLLNAIKYHTGDTFNYGLPGWAY